MSDQTLTSSIFPSKPTAPAAIFFPILNSAALFRIVVALVATLVVDIATPFL